VFFLWRETFEDPDRAAAFQPVVFHAQSGNIRRFGLQNPVLKASLQTQERQLPIPDLRPFFRSGADDPRRQMDQPDRGIGAVDMLPPCSGSPERFHPEIFRPDRSASGFRKFAE